MPATTANELREFHRFLSAKLDAGGNALTPEDVLAEWRRLHPTADAFDEELAAIRDALDDVANGNVSIPLDEFDNVFRHRHNLSPGGAQDSSPRREPWEWIEQSS